MLRGIVSLAALSGCIAAFNYTNCWPEDEFPSALKAGDQAYVCVHLNGHMTAVVTPKVDRYDALVLQGANYGLPSGSGYIQDGAGWVAGLSEVTFDCGSNEGETDFYITVDVSLRGVTSTTPRIYKKIKYRGCAEPPTSQVETVPLLTAIINLKDGEPEYIEWDDGCYFCASNGDECVKIGLDTDTYSPYDNDNFVGCVTPADTCYPTKSASSGSATTPTPTPSISASPTAGAALSIKMPVSDCDLKIFFVWTGTDKEGEYLTSAGKRFSRFRQYGTASAYQGAIFLASEALDKAEQAVGLVDGVPGRLLPGTSDE